MTQESSNFNRRSTSLDGFERHTASWVTTELVGRDEPLQRILQAVESPEKGPRVIALSGDGGIGKTYLMRVVIDRLKANVSRRVTNLYPPEAVVDFYHIANHTQNGLASAINQVLKENFSLLANPFAGYDKTHQSLTRMILAGETSRMVSFMNQEMEEFNLGMKAAAAGGRVVIALDTMEQLFFGSHPNGRHQTLVAEAWEWLKQCFPAWGDVVLLLAGRKSAVPLFHELEKLLPGKVVEIPLASLSESEGVRYFDVVQYERLQANDIRLANALAQFTPEQRQVASILSGGRPILLALVVDYLATTTTLPPIMGMSSMQVKALSARTLSLKRRELEKDFIHLLMNSIEIGDTLRALGRLRKGADARLLAQVLPCSLESAEVNLQRMRDYSFVKIRPSDQRIFLHDEMYAMLDRHAFADKAGGAAEADIFEENIQIYYKDQNKSLRDQLNAIFQPVESKKTTSIDMLQVGAFYTQRRELLSERCYYHLRHDPILGFKRCYRLLREAFLSGDYLSYLQIRLELQNYVVESKLNQNAAEEPAIRPELVVWELSQQSLVKKWNDQLYDDYLDEVERLRQDAINKGYGVVEETSLDIYEAYGLISLGGESRFARSQELLTHGIENLDAFRKHHPEIPEVEAWRADVLKAQAFRIRGFFSRMGGKMQKAVDDYRVAARIFHDVDLRIELATTLNDMGYAQGELGRWSDARALVDDALDLRRYLGPRSNVALSLNTLSLINTREGNQDAAMNYAESALAVSRAIGSERIAALALTALAEAQRRKSADPSVPNIEDKIALLRQARDNATEALGVFKQLKEEARQVDALIEIGCANRDWVKFRLEKPTYLDQVGDKIKRGAEALRSAAVIAGDAILYRKVDALVNLALLGYYSGEHSLVDEAAGNIKGLDINEYYFNPQTGQPALSREDSQISIWPQIGKLHVCHGLVAFAAYKDKNQPRPEKLQEAVREFTLGLEYSLLFGPDYQGIRKAKDDIYRLLLHERTPALINVATYVRLVEQEYHFKESMMCRFLKDRALWYEE